MVTKYNFSIFLFSEIISVICLMLLAVLVRITFIKLCFLACKISDKNNNTVAENIPLEERNSPTIMEILHGDDKIAIKKLISEESHENTQLKQNLRMINLDGSGLQDLDARRMVNKSFLDCLMEVQLTRPAVLIWLKKHIEFETCKTMLSDWNYSGT